MKFEVRASIGSNPPVPGAEWNESAKNVFNGYGRFEIELNTIEDLLALTREVGDLIIQENGRIIVYDDFIE
jgi:hypothetical protein